MTTDRVRLRARDARPRRRGMTMIEVMVLLTAAAVMLGMTVVVLQLAMKLDVDGRGRLERANALERLSRRFRTDVHAATAVEAAEAALIVETTNRSIRYDAFPDGKISRSEKVDGAVAARETFVVPQTGTTRLSVREIDDRRFAVLALDAVVRKDRIDPARTLEILALAGKDQRSTKTEGGKP